MSMSNVYTNYLYCDQTNRDCEWFPEYHNETVNILHPKVCCSHAGVDHAEKEVIIDGGCPACVLGSGDHEFFVCDLEPSS